VAQHGEDVAARERADESAVRGARDDGDLVQLAVVEAREDRGERLVLGDGGTGTATSSAMIVGPSGEEPKTALTSWMRATPTYVPPSPTT
jgi:hypothetical protein